MKYCIYKQYNYIRTLPDSNQIVIDSTVIERKGIKMELRPIRTEAEYEMALSEVSAYFSDELDPGTADAECFERLCQMIQAYEAKH